MKKANKILNIIMCAILGLYVVDAAYVVLKYIINPQFFAMQSAPWYTSIWVDGVFTLIVLAVLFFIKTVIKLVYRNK